MNAGVDIIRLRARWLENQSLLLQEIRTRGRQIWVTAGKIRGRRLEHIVGLGVDGLITDYPDQALQPMKFANALSSRHSAITYSAIIGGTSIRHHHRIPQ